MQSEEIFVSYPDIVGIEDIVKMLNVGKTLAYNLIRQGKIKAKKVGREYKITKAAVINYICEGGDNER